MSQPGIVVNLASGGTVRVTDYLVQVHPPGDATAVTFDVQQLVSVQRDGTTVRMVDSSNVITTLDMASLDDAGQLESTVRRSVSSGVHSNQASVALSSKTLDSMGIPLGILGAAALTIIGSLGPWGKVLFVTVAGTDGDGVITLLLALVAAVLAILEIKQPGQYRWTAVALIAAMGICAAVGINSWISVNDVVSESEFAVSVGWGLQLTVLAAIGGTVLSLVYLKQRPKAVTG